MSDYERYIKMLNARLLPYVDVFMDDTLTSHYRHIDGSTSRYVEHSMKVRVYSSQEKLSILTDAHVEKIEVMINNSFYNFYDEVCELILKDKICFASDLETTSMEYHDKFLVNVFGRRGGSHIIYSSMIELISRHEYEHNRRK